MNLAENEAFITQGKGKRTKPKALNLFLAEKFMGRGRRILILHFN
jgi:hypothetical protein